MDHIEKIIYSPTSSASLQEIYKYIAKDNKTIAKKQINQVYNSIDLIKENPYIGIVGRIENTREFFIPFTNYFIVYKLEKNKLYIVDIIHTSKQY